MSKEQLLNICTKSLELKGLSDDSKYKKRLKWELDEIFARQKWDYFLNLFENKIRYSKNQNNLLVCWLLGIVKDFDIEQAPACEYGEYPDIDVDYLKEVREYLKGTWAPKYFGEEYVCNIGSYTTFGIKNTLLDMARVHDKSRDEVLALTKNIENKDEDGDPITWETALKQYPELAKYCEENKDVAQAVRKLLHRNRGMGVHAAGLIIANSPLHQLVPLYKRKDSLQASAWTEGLHGQDLGPVGLVKFDLLVIANLKQIAICCELIKKRHGIEGICNLPGQPDWSDVPKWRNDPKALEMASRGDLKCIFQFDSEGIRNLVKNGGVDSFEDLVAYTALYRPGPLGMKMQERYVERKKGRESYSLHPLIKPILEKSYGVLVYQEDIMKILHVVGEIPLKDCEYVRKAISKKKIETFIKYKEVFVRNGMKNLQVSEEEMNNLWDQIQSFAEYGFNKSHAVSYTYISAYLLYLKAHYPEEFFASVLSCENKTENIKSYKMEARVHRIEVCPVDINLSDVNFVLRDNKIYFGLSSIKGITEVPAQRIVDNQPYANFEDFLNKFGTDADVIKAIVGLRCFKDADPITLYKFYEVYKEALKKKESRQQKYVEAMEGYEAEFKKLVPDETRRLSDLQGENPFEDSVWKKFDVDESSEILREVKCKEGDQGAYGKFITIKIDLEDTNVSIEKEVLQYYRKAKVPRTWNRWKELKKLWLKRQKRIENQKNYDAEILPKLANFDPRGHEIDKKIAKDFSTIVAGEEKFYGFPWIHELEKSPDYTGNKTFESLKNDSNNNCGPVELKVLKIESKQSKKNKNFTYYQITAEDVTSQEGKINIWPEDWERWSQEFAKDNLLRVRLQPPSGGFPTFTLEPNQIGKYRNQKKWIDKQDDYRVVIMQKPPVDELKDDEFLNEEEVLNLFSNCTME
jgi:DNA polymerase III alpha subunit